MLTSGAIPTPAEILAVNREILQRPEFQPRTGWETWLETLLERLRIALESFQAWLQAHPSLQGILFIGLSVLLVLLVLHLGRLVWQETRGTRRLRHRRMHGEVAAPGDQTAWEWDAAAQEVREALHRGDGYEAMRCLYRLLLLFLDRHGVVVLARWKTNADYVRECPATHPVHALLVGTSQTYEQVVYAHQEVPHETIAALLKRIEGELRNPGTETPSHASHLR